MGTAVRTLDTLMTPKTKTTIRVPTYPCALCMRRRPADEMIHSRHTGNRYCGRELEACNTRYRRLRKRRATGV